jgi:hypothetical protein
MSTPQSNSRYAPYATPTRTNDNQVSSQAGPSQRQQHAIGKPSWQDTPESQDDYLTLSQEHHFLDSQPRNLYNSGAYNDNGNSTHNESLQRIEDDCETVFLSPELYTDNDKPWGGAGILGLSPPHRSNAQGGLGSPPPSQESNIEKYDQQRESSVLTPTPSSNSASARYVKLLESQVDQYEREKSTWEKEKAQMKRQIDDLQRRLSAAERERDRRQVATGGGLCLVCKDALD